MKLLIVFLLGIVIGNAIPLYVESIVKREPVQEYCAAGVMRNGKCHVIHYGATSNRTKYFYENIN